MMLDLKEVLMSGLDIGILHRKCIFLLVVYSSE